MIFKIFQKHNDLEKKQKIIIYSVFSAIIILLLSVSAVASYRYFAKQKTTAEQGLEKFVDFDQEINLL